MNTGDSIRVSYRPMIVGVLNVTPDSFSDGGAYVDVSLAVERGMEMEREGADVIDVGGESTRPGAQRIEAGEQIRRVVPVIEGLRGRLGAAIGVDTTRAAVARAALDAGASMINDVSAGRDDEEMLGLAAERGAAIVLMHMKGEPATMQEKPAYGDVVGEVLEFLLGRAAEAQRRGVAREKIVIDPGIGFGKTAEHNWELLRNVRRFVETGYAVMVGASRKGFLGKLTGEQDPAARDAATAAVTALAISAGVRMVRVHNVRMNRAAADVAWWVSGRANRR